METQLPPQKTALKCSILLIFRPSMYVVLHFLSLLNQVTLLNHSFCTLFGNRSTFDCRCHFALTLLCYILLPFCSCFGFQRVITDWSAALFTLFNMGARQIDELQTPNTSELNKLISIDDYLNGYLMERKSRYGKKMEVLDLGMQEIRTYFRLFLLSSVLLMFMFCSRISKSSRPLVSAMSM